MAETLPTSPGPQQVNVTFASNSSVYVSPLTGATQVAGRSGGLWQIEYTLPPMNRRQAGEWFSLMTKLNGAATSVYLGPHNPRPVDFYDTNAVFTDPQAPTLNLDFTGGEYALRWITTPTPLVNGASQTGTSLVTDGWSEGDGLNPGDYISFENGTFRELHIVTAESFANSSGQMTISISPAIRRSPANNAAVTVVNCTGEFIAADNEQAREQFMGNQGYRTMSFNFRELIK